MIPRVCTCGRIVNGTCPNCYPRSAKQSTETEKKKGYRRNRWRTLSERIRSEEPLCWKCIADGKKNIQPARHVHHIVKVGTDKSKMYDRNNLIPCCEECHLEIEQLAESEQRTICDKAALILR